MKKTHFNSADFHYHAGGMLALMRYYTQRAIAHRDQKKNGGEPLPGSPPRIADMLPEGLTGGSGDKRGAARADRIATSSRQRQTAATPPLHKAT